MRSQHAVHESVVGLPAATLRPRPTGMARDTALPAPQEIPAGSRGVITRYGTRTDGVWWCLRFPGVADVQAFPQREVRLLDEAEDLTELMLRVRMTRLREADQALAQALALYATHHHRTRSRSHTGCGWPPAPEPGDTPAVTAASHEWRHARRLVDRMDPELAREWEERHSLHPRARLQRASRSRLPARWDTAPPSPLPAEPVASQPVSVVDAALLAAAHLVAGPQRSGRLPEALRVGAACACTQAGIPPAEVGYWVARESAYLLAAALGVNSRDRDDGRIPAALAVLAAQPRQHQAAVLTALVGGAHRR